MVLIAKRRPGARRGPRQRCPVPLGHERLTGFSVLDEARGRDAQAVSQAQGVLQGELALAALDLTDIRPVKARRLREALLGEARAETKGSHPGPEGGQIRVLVVLGLHAADDGSTQTLYLETIRIGSRPTTAPTGAFGRAVSSVRWSERGL